MIHYRSVSFSFVGDSPTTPPLLMRAPTTLPSAENPILLTLSGLGHHKKQTSAMIKKCKQRYLDQNLIIRR